ncbi:MAG: methyltransferase domain-containing protein [Deltaproteobacteria bacterium]|nr:methyltransferase domain-containing protein [Deltaproteobacteria bacterium]
MCSQDRVWAYFQNNDPGVFEGAKPRLNFLIKQISQKAKNTRPKVLNIGAGNGYFELRCKKLGWEVYCLDPDENTILRLRHRGIRAFNGYIEDMPFKNVFFDFVIASEVLEHLTVNQRKQALNEVHRVMGPGAWFLGSVPYKEELTLNQAVCPNCGETFHRWGHKDSFDCYKLQAELSAIFQQVRVKRTVFVQLHERDFLRQIKGIMRIILGRFGSAIAMPNIYFEARKRHSW